MSGFVHPLGAETKTPGQLLKELVGSVHYFPFAWSAHFKLFVRLALAIVERATIGLIAFVVGFLPRLIYKVEVRGKENMARDGANLYLAKHPSYIATCLLEAAVFFPWILGNMEMFPINVGKLKHLQWLGPIWWLLRHFGVIGLPKRSGNLTKRSAVVQQEIELLSLEKVSLILFANGTRTKPENKGLPGFMNGIGRAVLEAADNGSHFRIIFIWINESKAQFFKGRRRRLVITVSKSLEVADPETRIYHVCKSLEVGKLGEVVSSYLHDLCLAWAATIDPEVTGLESIDQSTVATDLKHLQ